MKSTRTPEALEALKKEIGEWDLCPVKKHLVEAYISTEKRYTVKLKEENQG